MKDAAVTFAACVRSRWNDGVLLMLLPSCVLDFRTQSFRSLFCLLFVLPSLSIHAIFSIFFCFFCCCRCFCFVIFRSCNFGWCGTLQLVLTCEQFRSYFKSHYTFSWTFVNCLSIQIHHSWHRNRYFFLYGFGFCLDSILTPLIFSIAYTVAFFFLSTIIFLWFTEPKMLQQTIDWQKTFSSPPHRRHKISALNQKQQQLPYSFSS